MWGRGSRRSPALHRKQIPGFDPSVKTDCFSSHSGSQSPSSDDFELLHLGTTEGRDAFIGKLFFTEVFKMRTSENRLLMYAGLVYTCTSAL